MGYFLDLLQETQRLRAEKKMQDDVAEIQRRARQAGRDIADGCIAFANALRNKRDLNKEVEFITVPKGWCKKEFERSKRMSKPKFKNGDRVRLLDGSKIKEYTASWAKKMQEYVGTTTTINAVLPDYAHTGRTAYLVDANAYKWDERGLELVEEKKEKKPSKNTAIIIYRKGDDTIALDKATGKTAKATCSKDDEYDFYTGAKLALGRLTEPTRKFKVGDRVIGNKKASEKYLFTNQGWRGVVKEIHNYPFIDVQNENGTFHAVEETCFDLDTEEQIKVGDKVRIVDTGKMLTTNYKLVASSIKDPVLIAQYAYGYSPYERGIKSLPDTLIVKELCGLFAYVQKFYSPHSCYLVCLDGLKKV